MSPTPARRSSRRPSGGERVFAVAVQEFVDDGDGNANGDTDGNTNGDTDGNTDSDTDSNTDSNTNGDTDGHANGDTDAGRDLLAADGDDRLLNRHHRGSSGAIICRITGLSHSVAITSATIALTRSPSKESTSIDLAT